VACRKLPDVHFVANPALTLHEPASLPLATPKKSHVLGQKNTGSIFPNGVRVFPNSVSIFLHGDAYIDKSIVNAGFRAKFAPDIVL